MVVAIVGVRQECVRVCLFEDMYQIYHHFIVNDVKPNQLYGVREREMGTM